MFLMLCLLLSTWADEHIYQHVDWFRLSYTNTLMCDECFNINFDVDTKCFVCIDCTLSWINLWTMRTLVIVSTCPKLIEEYFKVLIILFVKMFVESIVEYFLIPNIESHSCYLSLISFEAPLEAQSTSLEHMFFWISVKYCYLSFKYWYPCIIESIKVVRHKPL